MFRFVVFFSVKFHIISVVGGAPWPPATPAKVVSAAVLRGSQVSDTGANASASGSSECGLCSYKGDVCGCGPAMDYLACLTTHCYPSDQIEFVNGCASIQSQCYSEVSIDCRGPETECKSKFHQLSPGGLGLTWDPSKFVEDAFCGPFGQCIGEIHMTVNIHGSQASAPAVAKDEKSLPCEDSVKVKVAPKMPMVLECGLPKHAKADIDKPWDWTTCSSAVSGGSAACDLPMNTKLEAQQSLESYCVLTDGQGGKRLTQPVWRMVANTVKKSRVYTQPAVAQEQDKLIKHEGQVVRMPSGAARKRGAETVENARESMDVTIDARDMKDVKIDARDTFKDIGKAADEKPPYMKYSDAEKKAPPPGHTIVQDVSDLTRRTQKSSVKAAHGARKNIRESSQEVNATLARRAAEAKEPIVRSAEDLQSGAEKGHARTAAEAAQMSNKAAKVARKSGETVEKVRKTKPPYMKAYREDPLPVIEAVRMLNAKTQPRSYLQTPELKEPTPRSEDTLKKDADSSNAKHDKMPVPVVEVVHDIVSIAVAAVPQSPFMAQFA